MVVIRSILLLAILLVPSHGADDPLTTTKAVRNLERARALQHLPVLVRGVVTCVFPGGGSFIFEQDGTGIFVSSRYNDELSEASREKFNKLLEPGEQIEIRGVTDPGKYAPIIVPFEIVKLGRVPLPPPRPFVLSEALSGTADCQIFEVTGVVQDEKRHAIPGYSQTLSLVVPGGVFTMDIARPAYWPSEEIVGATVKVRAVCMSFFNRRGEYLGVRLEMQDPSSLTILKPAPTDPFDVPEVPLSQLRPFLPTGPVLDRQKITGTVIFSRPGDFLYLEGEGKSIRVNTSSRERFAPGDLVEASGFIDIGRHSAELYRALVRRVGKSTPPLAQPTSRDEVIRLSSYEQRGDSPDYQGRLVTLRGIAERIETTAGGDARLFLSDAGESSTILLDKDNGAIELFRLRPGSEVSVTGICEVLFRENQRGSDFPRATGLQLLMRSPADVAVLRAASWWTKARLFSLLGATLGILAIALTWAWLLKRKVNERTLQLASEIQSKHNVRLEFEATLRERSRLAGDLHDTVEQAFTAVSFQFQTARALRELNPEKAESHLLLAEELLSLSRDELRRSVWDLRNEVLEGRSLKEALLHHTARIVSDHSIICEVFADDETPIPDLVAGHLMLFAQEALNNVLKHAKASKVVFHLTHNEDGLRLSIEDNGHGFDPASVPGAASGHFGLTGLRERIRRLGGTFSLESSIGHGTRLVAEIPAAELVS